MEADFRSEDSDSSLGSLAQRSYIYYDPERTDYSVSSHELEQLENLGRNLWKEFFLVSCPTGLAFALHGIESLSTQTVFHLTLGMFLDLLLGIVGLALSICFAVLWRRYHCQSGNLIATIKAKPRLRIFAEDRKALILSHPYNVPMLPFKDDN